MLSTPVLSSISQTSVLTIKPYVERVLHLGVFRALKAGSQPQRLWVECLAGRERG